ncbi:MAG TPA: hypothetical protein VF240_09655 [Pyrinomonadaceae bacterium]
MKHRSRLIALVALLFAAAIPASANIAPPNVPTKPPRQTTGAPVRMQLRPDADAKEAKLIIPRKVLQQLKAELDGGADPQTAAAAVASSGSNLSSTQTAVAGVFLSLSLVLGGVWLAGSRAPGRRVSRVVSALAFAALGGAAASGVAVYANAGPPPVARSLTSKILAPDLSYWGASGVVKIEIANDESLIMLVLPKAKDAATAGE